MVPGGAADYASAVTRRTFVAAILFGVVLHATTLTSTGAGDLATFSGWVQGATRHGVAAIYRAAAADPQQRIVVEGHRVALDYPPLALYLLAVAGHASQAVTGGTSLFHARLAVRLLVLGFEAALAALMWDRLHRLNAPHPRVAVAGFWANPAIILHAALGYLGPVAWLPAFAAIITAAEGVPLAAGALLAAAVLTKPTGVLMLPAVLVALGKGGVRHGRDALAGAAIIGFTIALPLAHHSALTAAGRAVFSLVTEGTLSSSSATNVWWIVGYATQVASRIDAVGIMALATPAQIAPLTGTPDMWSSLLGYPLVICGPWLAVGLAAGWAMARVRRDADVMVLTALGAFTVHAFFTLANQAHENHLAMALPLLAFVAASRREYRYLLAGTSLVVFGNLFLFFGLGDNIDLGLPRQVWGLDLTIAVALFNLVLFVAHGRTFRRLASATPTPAADAASAVTAVAG